MENQRNTGGQRYGAVVRVKRGLFCPAPCGLITRPVQTALLNSIDGTPQPISHPTPRYIQENHMYVRNMVIESEKYILENQRNTYKIIREIFDKICKLQQDL